METDTMTGPQLMKEVINTILADPKTFDQSTWHSPCGTKHCFAGWGQIKAGCSVNSDTAKADAKKAFGLTSGEADWAFAGHRTLSELYWFVYAKLHPEEFDEAGFNRDGFDRAGFNRAGFDRAGFNRDGFDRDGFDRNGFDRNGFNRDGSRLLPLE